MMQFIQGWVCLEGFVGGIAYPEKKTLEREKMTYLSEVVPLVEFMYIVFTRMPGHGCSQTPL